MSKLEDTGKRGRVHQGSVEEVMLLVKGFMGDGRIRLPGKSFGLEELAGHGRRAVVHDASDEIKCLLKHESAELDAINGMSS